MSGMIISVYSYLARLDYKRSNDDLYDHCISKSRAHALCESCSRQGTVIAYQNPFMLACVEDDRAFHFYLKHVQLTRSRFELIL